MATKLYPPNIQGTIPAFAGTTMVVPFSMNRAVSKAEILGFSLKVKTVQGSVLLGTKTADQGYFNLDKLEVSFNIEDLNLRVGQHYKIQLAYIGQSGVGYYSTVGVIKCTAQPEISILGLQAGRINGNLDKYTGVYSQSKDYSEKLYSSKFKLYNKDGEVLLQSEEILHNVTNDTSAYEASEDFVLNYNLEENTSYYIQFLVTTVNGYTTSTPKYRIMQKKSIMPEIDATLSTVLSYDDGYIDLYLIGGTNEDSTDKTASGTFAVSRAASNDDYIWHQVCEFSLQNEVPTRFLWRDYTIEQGVTYKYSIQQYNDYGLYSSRIESEEIVGDFEDAFLYDGKRQLKIRYNPSINSFKTDIPENKTETIGHKYPFIFRNGNVSYKEFPISGLISYQMDDNRLFMNWEDRNDINYTNTDLSSDNFYSERLFKLEVLDWLNNGEKKLFRSPSEGNYIVQLLTTSLSANQTVGRMLHTFSSTAYEVADFSYDNLTESNLLTVSNATETQTKWTTIDLASHSTELDAVLANVRRYVEAGIIITFTEEQYNRIIAYNPELESRFVQEGSAYILNHPTKNKIETDDSIIDDLEDIIGKVTYATGKININPMTSIYVTDMLPGTEITLTLDTSDGIVDETITIGATGSYKAEFETPITAITIPQIKDTNNQIVTNSIQGSITYSYESVNDNIFNTIQTLEIIDMPFQQWIGEQSKTYYNREIDDYKTTTNLIEIIENEKNAITEIFEMRFIKRPTQKIFVKDNSKLDTEQFYEDMDCTIPLDLDNLDDYYMYQICNARFDYTYKNVHWEKDFIDSNFEHGYYVDKDGNWIKEGITYDRNYTSSTVVGYTIDEEGNHIDNTEEVQGAYVYEDGTPVLNREDLYLYPVDTGYMLDGLSTSSERKIYDSDTYSNEVIINGDSIDLSEIERYDIKEMDTTIETLEFNNGIICELSYQIRELTYNAETADETVKGCKDIWENQVNKLLELRENCNVDVNDADAVKAFVKTEQSLIKSIHIAYDDFIKQLTVILKNYEGINGIV